MEIWENLKKDRQQKMFSLKSMTQLEGSFDSIA
jgi:hypothetical protein